MWGSAPHRRSQRSGHAPAVPADSYGGQGGRVEVLLTRGSLEEPWGFAVERARGDDSTLIIQRVFGGTSADSQQLTRGDVIKSVNGSDLAYLTYTETLELINQAGLELSLSLDKQASEILSGNQSQSNQRQTSYQQPAAQSNQQQYRQQPQQQYQQQKQYQQQQQFQQQYQPQLQQQNYQSQQQLHLQQQQQQLQQRQQQLLEQQKLLQQQQLLEQQQQLLEQQRQQQAYNELELEEQDRYEIPDRPSRTRVAAVRAEVTEDQNGFRSSSAGPVNRGRPAVKRNPAPSTMNLMEFGWTPKSMSATSRSVSQGALTEPGWLSRPKPQPKPKPPEMSLTEMGWSPKPKGGSSAVHASNPALNEMGWAPKVKPKPFSVSTINISSPQVNDDYQYNDVQMELQQQQQQQQQQLQQQQLLLQQQKQQIQQQSEPEPFYPASNPNEENQQHFATMPAWFNSLRSGGAGRQEPVNRRPQKEPPPPRSNDMGWAPKGLDTKKRVNPSPQSSAFKQPGQQYGQQFGQQFGQQYGQPAGQQEGMAGDPHWTNNPKKVHRSQAQNPNQAADQDRFVSQIQNIQLNTGAAGSPQPQQQQQQPRALTPQQFSTQQRQPMQPRHIQPQQQQQQYQQQLSQQQYQPQQQQPQSLVRSQAATQPALHLPYVPTQISTGQQQRFVQPGQQLPQQFAVQPGQQIGPQQFAQPRQPIQQQVQPGFRQPGQQIITPSVPQQFVGQQQQYAQPVEQQVQKQQAQMVAAPPGVVQQVNQPQITAYPGAAVAQQQPPAAVIQRASAPVLPPKYNAFGDFYVAEAVSRPEVAQGQRIGTGPRLYQGGFVDFYVIAGRAAAGAQQVLPQAKQIPSAASPAQAQKGQLLSSSGKTLTGGFVDFYVIPQGQGQAKQVVQKATTQPIPQQSSPQPITGKIRTGGFIDFYVIPQGSAPPSSAAKKIVAPTTPAVQTAGKIQSGGFVDFYVIKQGASPSVTPGKPSTASQGGAKSDSKFRSGGFIDFYVRETENKGISPPISQQPKQPVSSPQTPAVKQAAPQTAITSPSELAKNGKPNPKDAPKVTEQSKTPPGKVGNGAAGAVGQKPSPPGAQKVSTPGAFKDQLKSTKGLPGKLK